MLVAGGATLSVKDRQGNTPRDLALQAEDRDLAAYLYSESVHTFLFFLQRFIMKNSPFDWLQRTVNRSVSIDLWMVVKMFKVL